MRNTLHILMIVLMTSFPKDRIPTLCNQRRAKDSKHLAPTLRPTPEPSLDRTSTPDNRLLPLHIARHRPALSRLLPTLLTPPLHRILAQIAEAAALLKAELHQRVGVEHRARHALHHLEDLHRVVDRFDLSFAGFEDGERDAEERLGAFEEEAVPYPQDALDGQRADE